MLEDNKQGTWVYTKDEKIERERDNGPRALDSSPRVKTYKSNMPSIVHVTSYEIMARHLVKTSISW